MEDIEYYKSLVSDDEVIKALINESKAREGLLEKPRVRPNIRFFQRTVTNLVSSNNRVSEKQEQVKAIEKEKNKLYRPKKVPVKKKLPIEYIREILTNKIEFVKSSDISSTKALDNSFKVKETTDVNKLTPSAIQSSHQPLKKRKAVHQRKTPFQQIREILTNNIDKVNIPSSTSASNHYINPFFNSSQIQKSEEIDSSCLSDKREISPQKFTNFSCTIVSDSESSDSEKSVEITSTTVKSNSLSNFRSRKKQKIQVIE